MNTRVVRLSSRFAALLVASLSIALLAVGCGPSSPSGGASAPAQQADTAKPGAPAPATPKPEAPKPEAPKPEAPQPVTPTPDAPAAAQAAALFAVFECESGTIRAELATKEAPRLCANFINLANRGYFDGQAWTDFSRVVRQTGINPAGDPAYSIAREFGTNLFFDKPGRLCFSNNSDDVSTARAKPTRIFITVRPQDRWNLQYAVFGTIVEGLDVAMNLKDGEKIIRVKIEGDYAAHQARFAKQIAEWNAALDQVGLIDRR